MLSISYNRLRLINFFIIICIVGATLLAVRNIITFSLSRKNLHSTPVKESYGKRHTPLRKEFMSYAPILSNNPFGEAMKLNQISSRQARNEGVRSSPEHLQLVGTVVGPKAFSYAIFEDPTRRHSTSQEVVHMGEDVFQYGTLSHIDVSYVRLQQDSETVTIPIVENQSNSKPFRRPSSSHDLSLARRIGEREYLLNRTKVQQALDNPEQLLTDARLLPNVQKDKQEGFRMFEVKRGGIYDNLGLRNGDILLRVNELEISNPEVAINAMTALKGLDKVSLDIIRDGEKMTLDYEIR